MTPAGPTIASIVRPYALFNTGIDANGARLPEGATDPHYTISSSPTEPVPAVLVTAPATSIPWLDNTPSSGWISDSTNQGGSNAQAASYTYVTTFDLTGFDPDSARLDLDLSYDNQLTRVLLNGNDAGIAPAPPLFPGSAFESFTVDDGFKAGLNTLEFVVDNYHGPTGFRAELSGTAVTAVVEGGFTISAVAGRGTGPLALASITDHDGAQAVNVYDARIDWGDGSPSTTATIVGPDAGGNFLVNGQHTYATAGDYDITVTVDDGNGPGVVVTDTVSVSNPAPGLTGLGPASLLAGSPATTLTLSGTGFLPSSVAQLNGIPLATTYISPNLMTAVIPATDLATAGDMAVTVVTPGPGGGTSDALTLTVENPAPSLTDLAPIVIPVGSPTTTITLTGTGFNLSSVAQLNGISLATTYVSPTRLMALIPATSLATAGTLQLSVANPGPGGGRSAMRSLTVENPAPALASLGPASLLVGSPATTVVLTGTGFHSSSVVQLNGTPLATTYVSPTELTAVIPAAELATTGQSRIMVVTPGPGGGASDAFLLIVENPVPNLMDFSPIAIPVGSPTTRVTLTGTGFNLSSVAQLNGMSLTTTYVSPTELTALIPAASLATAGTLQLLVVNPGPGGGRSASRTFTVENPLPVLTGVFTANPLTAGSGTTPITITGTGFRPDSVVTLNGTTLTTTVIGATELSAIIPAADLLNAGTIALSVVNPGPGGGTSASLTLAIENPLPTVTDLSPIAIPAGSPDTTLTVVGTGFTSNSVVHWNGTPLPTTYVSATQLTATVPAGALAAEGQGGDPVPVAVTVVNPGPGGGPSAPLSLSLLTEDTPATAVLPSPVVSPSAAGVVAANLDSTTLSVPGVPVPAAPAVPPVEAPSGPPLGTRIPLPSVARARFRSPGRIRVALPPPLPVVPNLVPPAPVAAVGAPGKAVVVARPVIATPGAPASAANVAAATGPTGPSRAQKLAGPPTGGGAVGTTLMVLAYIHTQHRRTPSRRLKAHTSRMRSR